MKNAYTLQGEKVIVCSLEQKNLGNYLSVYKRAATLSKAYEMMPDFWETERKSIEYYVRGEKKSKARYLVIEKKALEACGFVELDYSNLTMPEVDIGILRKYRRAGYAFEAAKLLIESVFEKESVKCIVWSAFSSNVASCRIAEKLGGIVTEEKNILEEAICTAGFRKDDGSSILEAVTYEIAKPDAACGQRRRQGISGGAVYGNAAGTAGTQEKENEEMMSGETIL